MTKLIETVDGQFVARDAVTISEGSGSSGRIPALDSTGKLSSTLIPPVMVTVYDSGTYVEYGPFYNSSFSFDFGSFQ